MSCPSCTWHFLKSERYHLSAIVMCDYNVAHPAILAHPWTMTLQCLNFSSDYTCAPVPACTTMSIVTAVLPATVFDESYSTKPAIRIAIYASSEVRQAGNLVKSSMSQTVLANRIEQWDQHTMCTCSKTRNLIYPYLSIRSVPPMYIYIYRDINAYTYLRFTSSPRFCQVLAC